jgi:hypothetical protein
MVLPELSQLCLLLRQVCAGLSHRSGRFLFTVGSDLLDRLESLGR